MQPRLTEYLRRRCAALPAADRANLAGQLLHSLDGDKPVDCELELAKMRQAIKDAYQVDVLDRCRMQPGPYLRAAMAHIALARLPMNQSDVARWFGVRPCSVNYYTRMMRDALAVPGSNPALVSIYQNLMQTI